MLVLARVFVVRDENVGPAGDAASRAAPVLHIEYQALSIRENGVLVGVALATKWIASVFIDGSLRSGQT
jgi:hypothetical protein